MKLVDSYFLTAKEGEKLIRDGQPIGVAVWLAAGLSYDNIENIGNVETRPMLMPDEGKLLRNKETGETLTGGWLRDSKMEDWEEIDIPEETSETIAE